MFPLLYAWFEHKLSDNFAHSSNVVCGFVPGDPCLHTEAIS